MTIQDLKAELLGLEQKIKAEVEKFEELTGERVSVDISQIEIEISDERKIPRGYKVTATVTARSL